MQPKEILTIIALLALGLCLLLGLAKMAMKSEKTKKACDQACNLLFFVAVILVGISQLVVEMDIYTPSLDSSFVTTSTGPSGKCGTLVSPVGCFKTTCHQCTLEKEEGKNHCSMCKFGWYDDDNIYGGDSTVDWKLCCTENDYHNNEQNCQMSCAPNGGDGVPGDSTSCYNKKYDLTFPKDACPPPDRGLICDTRANRSGKNWEDISTGLGFIKPHCSSCYFGRTKVLLNDWCCSKADHESGVKCKPCTNECHGLGEGNAREKNPYFPPFKCPVTGGIKIDGPGPACSQWPWNHVGKAGQNESPCPLASSCACDGPCQIEES